MSGFKPVRVQHLAEVVNGYPFDSERFDTSNGYPLLRIRDVGADATEIRYTGEFVEAAVNAAPAGGGKHPPRSVEIRPLSQASSEPRDTPNGIMTSSPRRN